MPLTELRPVIFIGNRAMPLTEILTGVGALGLAAA
jgi:hypothetical protein